jgi:hypothetical protein
VTERSQDLAAEDRRGAGSLTVPPQDRRDHTERRKYSRRGIDLMSPPYHQTFERIAVALEHIEALLRERAGS